MIVSTGSGDLRVGVRDGVVEALAIPFARAPRFAPPRPVEPWPGVRDAVAFGPASLQPPGEVFLAVDMPQAEECLSLNVWARGDALDERRPVLVWVHGGGFRQGAGAHMLCHGDALARQGGVVVVTVNYRLGALGFAAHEAFAPERDTIANWALHDLVAALTWVRDEIAAFGGDAGNVTLFGESAGGTLVTLLGCAPAARGLFRRMIVQSGVPAATPLDRGRRLTEELASAAGVAHVRELVDVPAPAVLAAQQQLEAARGGRMVFMPVIDGAIVPADPLDALAAGAAAGVPLVIGTNVDEMRLLAAGDPRRDAIDAVELRRRLGKVFDEGIEEIIATYTTARRDRGEAVRPSDLWYAIESDRFFRVPSLRQADAHAAHEPRTFVYLFAWPSPALEGWLGACHVLEIPFVFGRHAQPQLAELTGATARPDAAETLHREMCGAWLAFARGDDPSTDALRWTPHEAGVRPTMVFDDPSRVEHAPREPERVVVARYSRS